MGFSFAQAMTIFLKKDEINFIPVFIDTGIALFVSPIDITENRYTLWVRENRQTAFVNESSISSHSTVSKIVIDCNLNDVKILTQKSYSQTNKLIAVSESPKIDDSTMSAVLFILLCNPTLPEPSHPVV